MITKNCYNNRLTALILTPTMLAVYQTESSIRMQKKLQQSVFLFAEMTQGVSEEVCKELLWLSVFFLWRFPVCCCLHVCHHVYLSCRPPQWHLSKENYLVWQQPLFSKQIRVAVCVCDIFFNFVGSFDKEDTILYGNAVERIFFFLFVLY